MRRSSLLITFLNIAILLAAPEPVHKGGRDSLPDLSDHAVVLMFDDGWHSVFTNAYPLLLAHGMKISLPLISDAVKGGKARYAGTVQSYMNQTEVRELITKLGAEVVSHSKTHPFLTKLSDDAIRKELSESKKELERLFGLPVNIFVYPYGDYNSRVVELVEETGYLLARSIHRGEIDFLERPFELPAVEVRKTTPVEKVKQVIKRHPSVILFFHRIVPEPAVYTEWSTSRFSELLSWLAATNVQVVTLSELYELRTGIRLTPELVRRRWEDRIEWDLLQQMDAYITRVAERR